MFFDVPHGGRLSMKFVSNNLELLKCPVTKTLTTCLSHTYMHDTHARHRPTYTVLYKSTDTHELLFNQKKLIFTLEISEVVSQLSSVDYIEAST